MPFLLTSADVAAATGLCPRAARRVMREHGGVRLGRRWFLAQDVFRNLAGGGAAPSREGRSGAPLTGNSTTLDSTLFVALLKVLREER